MNFTLRKILRLVKLDKMANWIKIGFFAHDSLPN